MVQETVWKADAALTAAFEELATAESFALAEGIEVIPLNSNLLGDDNVSSHLVTRSEQRAVVDYAFKVSRENLSKYSVTISVRGSPGIGKSWSSLLYIRKLMKQPEHRRPIIFERGQSPDERTTLLILPPSSESSSEGDDENKWTVHELQLNKVPKDWVECGIIDIVVDPAQFPKDTTPSPSVLVSVARGHCFIPVAPDDRHLGGTHKTSTVYCQLVLGPWSLKQLQVAFPFMLYRNPSDFYKQHPILYQNAMKTMMDYYYIVGGLPRYLVTAKGKARTDQITPENAAKHSQILLHALAEGKDFNDASTEQILTRFFTLRAGEDENGYNPTRRYATLDFVSPGAIRAIGKILLEKIHKDARWRGSDDASDVGLAFERVVLVFLAQGTEGMKRLGLKIRCKQLLSRPRGDEVKGSAQTVDSPPVQCVFIGSRNKIDEAPSNEAFESEVSQCGKGMSFADNVLTSNKCLLLPPDGYSNFDGMAGNDVGFNATLQKNHSVSGHEYIRQRKEYGLSPGDNFAHVFVVPPDRFDNDWFYFQNFSWTGDEAATTNRKRRKVKASGTAQPVPKISANEKERARASMRQFVLTLEIEDNEEEEETEQDAMTTD